MSKPTKADFIEIVSKRVDLCDDGLVNFSSPQGSPRFRRSRETLMARFEDFEHCCRWLEQQRLRKTVNSRIGTSYGLKHIVEKEKGDHISNGAFIAAVFYLGIPWAQRANSRDISVAISSRSPGLK